MFVLLLVVQSVLCLSCVLLFLLFLRLLLRLVRVQEFRKVGSELLAAIAQPPFHRCQRQGQKGGDAGGRPLLVIEQQQDGLAIGREAGKQGAYGFLLFGADHQVERAVRARVGRFGGKAVEAGGFHEGDAASTLCHAPRPPPRNHAQPACELGGVLQLPQRAEREYKRFLRYVLCRLQSEGTNGLPDDKNHGVPKATDEFVVGFQAAPLRQFHQLAVFYKLETARDRHRNGSLLPL